MAATAELPEQAMAERVRECFPRGEWECVAAVDGEGRQLMVPAIGAGGRFYAPGSIEFVGGHQCNKTVVPGRCEKCDAIIPQPHCHDHAPATQKDALSASGGWHIFLCESCYDSGDEDGFALFEPHKDKKAYLGGH